MSQRIVEKYFKPKRYQTEQIRTAEESEVIDPRMKIDLLTRELILRYRLTNRIAPVLSIPLAYNKDRGVFELIETPSLITSRLQAYYYPTLPSETTPGYVDLATDAQHRLYVTDDKLENALASIARDKLRVSVVDALPRSPVTIYDSSNNELSSYLKNLDTALSVFKGLFTPILKASVFNASVSANTNIFASALTPTYSPTLFRIYCAFNAAGILSVTRTRGTTTVTEQLNSGASLNANAAYVFDVVVESGDRINLQYIVSATALVIKVVEIPSML
jgi:hypothetical protein